MNSMTYLFAPFKYRDYRLAWIGFFISQIGSEMMMVAVNWQIYLMTGSPFSLGIIGAARFLPMLFLSLFAGLVADLVNRKKLIFTAQLVLIFSSACLSYLTFTHQLRPVMIYLLIALNSGALAFASPARQSLLPHLVPRKHFMQAVSLNSLMWQTAVILGPTISGFLIAFLGVEYIYLISIFAFTSINISMILMRPLPLQAEKAQFSLRSIREGIGFVKRTPILWSSMLLDFFATFFASSMTLMPIFAKDILKVGPQGLGFLYAAPSVGGVLAGLIFSFFHRVGRQGKILLASVCVYGIATIVFGLSQIYILSLLCLVIAGAGDMVSSVIRNTIRHMITPDHIRGRMVSINMIFYLGGPQLGEVEAGIAATLMGTPWSVVFGGVGTIAITFIMAKIVPSLLNYNNHNEID